MIASGPDRAHLVLRGGTVVTMDDRARVIERGVVVVHGDRIAAVGTEDELGSVAGDTTIDCDDTVVIPGLVDAHTHLFQAAAAGRGDGLPVTEWLRREMWPDAAGLAGSDVAAVVALGAVRSIRAGSTAVLDHHYGVTSTVTTLAVADAIGRVGLRGVVARGMIGERHVRDVVVGGRVAVRERRCTLVDETDVLALARARAGPTRLHHPHSGG